jgi:hypothetical protein
MFVPGFVEWSAAGTSSSTAKTLEPFWFPASFTQRMLPERHAIDDKDDWE